MLKRRYIFVSYILIIPLISCLAHGSSSETESDGPESEVNQIVTLDSAWPSYLGLNIGERRIIRLLSGKERLIEVASVMFYGNDPPGPDGIFCSVVLSIESRDVTLNLYVGDKTDGTRKVLEQPFYVNGIYLGIEGTKEFGGITSDALIWIADASEGIAPGGYFPFTDADKNINISEILWGNTFMNYHYYTASATTHTGIDFILPEDTPLIACFSGVVTYVDPNQNYELLFTNYDWPGNMVFRYGHQNSINVVEGQVLYAEDSVGLSGGVDDGGVPHLHLEMHAYGIPNSFSQMDFCFVNPWPYVWYWLRQDRKSKGLIQSNVAPLYPSSVGESIAFSSTGSQPNTGSGPLAYYWEFGDGQSSTQANPTHIYTGAGVYLVRLTVTDNKPDSAWFEQYITVE